jgi:hypothetical protein
MYGTPASWPRGAHVGDVVLAENLRNRLAPNAGPGELVDEQHLNEIGHRHEVLALVRQPESPGALTHHIGEIVGI